MIQYKFNNASEAFDFYYGVIPKEGIDFDGTKAMFNQGFTLEKPWERMIHNEKRKFNITYAMAEWEWYLTGDPSVDKLGEIYGKVPQIWERMADVDGNVNSNYGYQWKRKKQLTNIIAQLKSNPNTRQAAISIYGFCNDQYCFSQLQELVCNETGYDMGTYYHFAHNLHLYNRNLPEVNTLTRRAEWYG